MFKPAKPAMAESCCWQISADQNSFARACFSFRRIGIGSSGRHRSGRCKFRHAENGTRLVYFSKNILAIGFPDESFRSFVADADVIIDRLFEAGDRTETAVAYAIACNFPEETLDEIHPRTRSRSEMQFDSRMFFQPCGHGRVLVRRVIVQHDVDLYAIRNRTIDLLQELQPLRVGMRLMVIMKNATGSVVESGEKRRRAVAYVIVRLRSDVSGAKLQSGLRSFKRLTLGLLVATEHDGVFGRIQIETDDVPGFRREILIAGDLERPRQMRFDAAFVPEKPDGVLRDADSACHSPCAVAGEACRRARRLSQDSFAHVRAD